MMSDQALYISIVIVGIGCAIAVWFVISIKMRQRANKDQYNWQPEQDYDVVMRGETPMTPGFPTLVSRKKTDQTDKS